MSYKALKPCRFDRFYSIGETIPADVVAYNMVSKLISIGLITPLPDEYAGNSDTEDEQVPQEDDNEFAGVNDQAEENTGAEDEQAPQDGGDKPERKKGRKTKNQTVGE